jgi:transposase
LWEKGETKQFDWNEKEKTRHGHITKRGSTVLRNAFVQMAMGIIRDWTVYHRGATSRLSRWYRKCLERKGGGKSKIALARRLSHVVWVMLQTGTPFSYDML